MSTKRAVASLSASSSVRSSGHRGARRASALSRSTLGLASLAGAAVVMMASNAIAAPLYYDTSASSGLNAGPATWDAGTTAAWQTSTSPGTTPPGVWVSGETAFFQANGTNTVTVSGTVIAEGIVHTAAFSGTGTTLSGGTIQLGAAGASNITGGNKLLTINSAISLATTSTTFTPDNFNDRNITINGVISELSPNSGITKAGAGSLVLGAVNNYTGTTTISLGSLRVDVSNAINSASAVNFSSTSASKLELRNNSSLTVAGLSSAGSVNLIVDTGTTASTASTLTIDNTGSFSYGGLINNGSGGGVLSLVKNGTGTQTLSRTTTSSNFTGGTTINAGVLAVGGSTVPSTNLGSGAVTITADGTLAVLGTFLQQNHLNAVAGSSTGTLALGGNVSNALNFSSGGGRNDLYLGSTGAFTYSASAANFTPGSNGYLLGGGGGTLTMGASNMLTGGNNVTVRGNVVYSQPQNYTGNTTITAGSLAIGAANLISDSSDLVLAGGTFNTGGFIETLDTLGLTDDSAIDFGTGASILTLSGLGTFDASKSLSLLNWSGTDHLFVGTSSFLSAPELAAISFINPTGYAAGIYPAAQLGTGEIVLVIPEPTSMASMLLLASMTLTRRRLSVEPSAR